jgi:hypothetical protein
VLVASRHGRSELLVAQTPCAYLVQDWAQVPRLNHSSPQRLSFPCLAIIS